MNNCNQLVEANGQQSALSSRKNKRLKSKRKYRSIDRHRSAKKRKQSGAEDSDDNRLLILTTDTIPTLSSPKLTNILDMASINSPTTIMTTNVKGRSSAMSSRLGHREYPTRSDRRWQYRQQPIVATSSSSSWKIAPRVGTFTLFFTSKYVFSNHFRCERLSIDDCDFVCTEQYYMYRKAKTFNDTMTAIAIMQCDDPKRMKALGSRVKNFQAEYWMRESIFAMAKANYRKYQQNADLRWQLFKTHGTTLVECNPKDQRWGIGLAMTNRDATNPSRWRGENILGRLLTKIRNRFWVRADYADEIIKVLAESGS